MDNSRKPYALAFGVALVLAFAAPVANATTTYAYTGNDFTFASLPPYTTSDFVSASFTFTGPLPVSTVLTNETSTLVTWSITIGYLSWNPSRIYAPSFTLLMAPDAAGGFTEWEISALAEPYDEFDQWVQTFNAPSDVTDYSWLGISHDPTAYVNNDPGVWIETTTSTVPEPKPTALVIIGGAVLLFAIRTGKHATGLSYPAIFIYWVVATVIFRLEEDALPAPRFQDRAILE